MVFTLIIRSTHHMRYFNYKFHFILILFWVIHCKSRKTRLAGGYPAGIGEYPYLVASMHPEVNINKKIQHKAFLLNYLEETKIRKSFYRLTIYYLTQIICAKCK